MPQCSSFSLCTFHYGRPFAWHQQAASHDFLEAWLEIGVAEEMERLLRCLTCDACRPTSPVSVQTPGRLVRSQKYK